MMPSLAESPQPSAKKRALTRAEFERFSPLIRRQAMLVARKAPRGVTVSDLCARGFAGLFAALTSVDLTDEAELESVVMGRVKSAMVDHLRSLDPGVRRARAESREVAVAIRVLLAATNHQPPRAEIARALGLSVSELENRLFDIHARGLARLELIDFDRPDSIRAEECETGQADLATAVSGLDFDSREVLSLVYQEGCHLGEVAAVVGASERSTTMLFTEAIHRLRAALGRE